MRKYPIKLRVGFGVKLDRVIEAVEELISYYKNPRATRYDGINCPLCALFWGCDDCLWQVFHHMECDEFAVKRFGIDVAEIKKDKKWRAFRVKDLKPWLQELKRPGVKIINK